MHMKSTLIPALALLAVPVLVLAQNPTENWVQVSTKNADVQLKLPPSYLVVDNNNPDFLKRLEDLKKNNPEWAKRIGDTSQSQYDLTANDLNAATGDNMNVRIVPSGGLQVSQYKLLGNEILKSAPFNGKGKQRIIDLPIGKTLNYNANARIKNGDGSEFDMYVSGYACLKGDKLYLFTFTTKSEAEKSLQKTADEVMKSVVIVR